MRVLHINCNYLGTALHQTMLQHFVETEIDGCVFVPTHNKTESKIKANDSVVVVECFRKKDRLCFKYKQKKILNALEQRVDVKSFDLIHAHTVFTDGNVAMQLKRRYQIPYVVAVRNTDVNTFFRYMIHMRKLGMEIIKNAEAVVFLSETYKNQVFSKYISENDRKEIENKTYVIPNGIDDFWLLHAFKKPRRLKQKEEVLRILYVGKIDKNKNIITTQKALRVLENRGYSVQYTVVGDVKNKRIYDRIKTDSNTTYLKGMDKEQLIKLYRMHDVFVMPSLKETFGLVYAEAMSQGLPVVYSKNQGFDGQFPEGMVGFSVENRNPESVADGIEKAFHNIVKCSEKCWQMASTFDWNKICKQYIQIYNKSAENI